MMDMTRNDFAPSDAGIDLGGEDYNSRERSCKSCGTAMTLLGRLPSIRLRRSIKVYRCYSCDTVISEPQ
jgi:hypothetical protein